MRKAMVLVAMLAMMMVLAAPAYAQTFVSQEVDQFGVVDDSVSSQVFNVGVQQFNAGDQIAVAVADADATATAGAFGSATAVAIADADAVNVANAAGISIQTINVSLNNLWW
jgi:hypothetical protein